ncbi:MAG: lectin like domain-containing protein [Lachnospiraceae bacterium]
MRRSRSRAGLGKSRRGCCFFIVLMVVSLTSGCGRFRWESEDSNVNSKGNRQTTEQEELADQENTTEQESTADQGQAQSESKGAESMKEPLPRFYDARQDGRTSMVKDQGEKGTCWAFASMQALESSLLPEESYDFSEDHMVHDPDFILNSEEGGDYVMAMAYLLSWRGPVLESQDPYGDGISPDGLLPVKHVQEIRLLPEGDREAIKRAVYTTGGVQSSLYTALQKAGADTAYYNQETQAYCYQGEEVPNHDVVIVGWDDDFPAENFTTKVPGNGAYLCENSWGTQFGEAGYFYVSYYDRNLGKTNLVYSRTEDPDNYSRIYQSDLCGWLGGLAYGEETVWATNVYRSGESAETLCAVGFYATDRDTEYEVYVIPKVPENQESVIAKLSAGGAKKTKLSRAKGKLEDAGYYTISLDQSVRIPPQTRFAVMVRLKTPGAVHPAAVEYDTGDGRFRVDLSDGEGYVSPDGSQWERTEEAQNCNLCLKAYTRIEKKSG